MPSSISPTPLERPTATPSHAPLAVTMGDACGIGPEVILMAHAQGALSDAVVVGDVAVLRRAARQLGLDDSRVQSRAQPGTSTLAVWPLPGAVEGWAPLAQGAQGQVNAMAGQAAAAAIREAVALVQGGQARAIVTAPIHKEALALAGEPYPGHTEMLQALAAGPLGALPPVRMMLASDALKVVLVTVHLALRQAIDALSEDGIAQTIVLTHQALTRMGLPAPRIAVAGLNPHAGEGGLFGDEEGRLIAPAIARARAAGVEASGPYAPDTVFMRARQGAFDAVVAMTHDHGLIPVKYMGLDDGVNITLGLPWVRTSPDHGTAFDIVGQGLASPASLIEAVRWARRLAP